MMRVARSYRQTLAGDTAPPTTGYPKKMPDSGEIRSTHNGFSDDEASRIWRRAAELQAQRRLPAQTESREKEGASQLPDHPRLSNEEILTIAREAGIDEEFVQQAITEAQFAPTTEEAGAYLIRRRVNASPAVLEETVRKVAVREPFQLRLIDIEPTSGGRALIFQLNGVWGAPLQAGLMAAGANITALHALVTEGGSPNTAELILYGVPNDRLPNAVRTHDIVFGGLGGVLGGGAGAGIALSAALGGAVLAAPIAAGALLLGGGGVKLMRSVQNWARRKDAASLEQLADEIVGAVRIRQHAGELPGG